MSETKIEAISKMSQVSQSDVEAIRDWLSKESYMPKTFDDLMLRKFLYSCDSSLERTKKCMEIFCTRRAEMSEIYTNRDPLSKEVQNIFSATNVAHFIAGDEEVLLHKVLEVPNNFDFYVYLKSFSIQVDNWLGEDMDVLPNKHVLVLDIKMYTISFLAKMNIFYLQKFILYLLEGMPLRLKQAHVINCPSFYEYMYNMIKPALPEYFCNLLHFHPDHTGLHKFIDKKYLPKEYGGDNGTIEEQSEMWNQDIYGKRKKYLNDQFWKADLSKKPANGNTSNTNVGSFRSLVID